jgi:ABC-type microcin C transport system permease subunit YejB
MRDASSRSGTVEIAMDTILIIVVLFVLFGGGGYWGYSRWR